MSDSNRWTGSDAPQGDEPSQASTMVPSTEVVDIHQLLAQEDDAEYQASVWEALERVLQYSSDSDDQVTFRPAGDDEHFVAMISRGSAHNRPVTRAAARASASTSGESLHANAAAKETGKADETITAAEEPSKEADTSAPAITAPVQDETWAAIAAASWSEELGAKTAPP